MTPDTRTSSFTPAILTKESTPRIGMPFLSLGCHGNDPDKWLEFGSKGPRADLCPMWHVPTVVTHVETIASWTHLGES